MVMPPAPTLRTSLAIASREMRGRAATVGLLLLAERVLAPTAAYVFVDRRESSAALLIGACSAAALVVRGNLQRRFEVRNEADLYARCVASLLRRTLLTGIGEDERVGLLQGLRQVALLLADVVPSLLANGLAAGVLAATLVVLEPRAVIVAALTAVVASSAFLLLMRRRVHAAQRDAWIAWNDLADGLLDACEAHAEIRAAGRSEDFIRRFTATVREWQGHALRLARDSGMLGRLPMLGLSIVVAGAVILESHVQGYAWYESATQAAVLVSAAPAFFGAARCLQQLTTDEQRLRLVAQVLSAESGTARATDLLPPTPCAIRWSSVSYRYPGSDVSALGDVSFTWSPGESLAIAGSNGSGKSTCLRLMLKLLQSSEGRIFVGDAPVDELDAEAWRRSIAFLPQRPYMPLRASVADCLRFHDPELDEHSLLTALKRVGLLEALQRSTARPLEVRAATLSAGERQRLGLARVLCRRAPFVILDEPDANLDADGVRLVAEVITDLARDRMVLVVAHAQPILSSVNRVITLDRGRVRSDVRAVAASTTA